MAIIGSAGKMLTLHTLHQISKSRCVISLKQKCSLTLYQLVSKPISYHVCLNINKPAAFNSNFI